MNRSVAFISAAALAIGFSTAAFGYSATADVTFTWGSAGIVPGWTSSGANTFHDTPTNTMQVFLEGGNNSTGYLNSDFASASDYAAGTTDDCLTPTPPYDGIIVRKYSCRQTNAAGYYSPTYNKAPEGGHGPGAAASGTLTVTDTTLTGTLTVISTTDVPTGATTTFNTCAAPCVGISVRTSNSVGDGMDGYNVRTADGSPFGNVWYGITTSATLTVDLTGTFTATDWTIDGGAVTFSDPGFACQQGGFGGDSRGTLCSSSTTGGGFQNDGKHLSWGMDTDGASTGTTVATAVEVKDVGGVLITTLSGVLAHLTLDGGGAITTTDGEIRYGSGSAGGGCLDHIRWGVRAPPETDNGIICGILTTTSLDITGTTGGAPNNPDPFTFVDQTDVAVSTPIDSAPISITGLSAAAPISISGDATSQYSINSGAFTNVAGTVNNNDTVVVRHTSSATASTAVNSTLTVGTVSDTFTSTTAAGGVITDPVQFNFVDQTGVAVSTPIDSAPISITGITAPAPISISGDATSQYSINSGAFTNVAGTVNNNDTVVVRHTSSATANTAVDSTLTVGTVVDTFTSTTAPVAGGTTPNQFNFVDQTGVALSTAIVSAPVTITGITLPSPISIGAGSAAGSDYSIGCTGTFTAVAGTINNNETVCVRHTSSASLNTATDTILDVGGVTDTFTSTTEDTTPDAFDLGGESDVALSTLVTSSTITVSGITAPATLVLSGDASSTCSVNGAAFAAACAATVDDGDTVAVQHMSSATNDTDVSTTLTIGGIADTFTSTTESVGGGGGGGLRADDGGSSLDALILALLGVTALIRRRR